MRGETGIEGRERQGKTGSEGGASRAGPAQALGHLSTVSPRGGVTLLVTVRVPRGWGHLCL